MAPCVTDLLMESVKACRENSERLALNEVAKYNKEEADRLFKEGEEARKKNEE